MRQNLEWRGFAVLVFGSRVVMITTVLRRGGRSVWQFELPRVVDSVKRQAMPHMSCSPPICKALHLAVTQSLQPLANIGPDSAA